MAMEIGHVHIKTYDPKKTAQFYIDNFGATMKNEAPNGNIQLNLHGLQLNVTTISAAQNRKQMMGIEHIALQTDDYAGAIAKLKEQRRAHHAGAVQQRPPRRLHRGPRRRPDGADREGVSRGSAAITAPFPSSTALRRHAGESRYPWRRWVPALAGTTTEGVSPRTAEKRTVRMALKDKIAFGMSLPHRSPDPIDMAAVRQVATRAEALGFPRSVGHREHARPCDLLRPVVVLTYAAAVTSKIRLGASVVVLQIHSPLMVAHQWACLDYVSSGRAILGVGIGREHHYRQFEVSQEGRVSRFREEVEMIKALWTEEKVTYHGRFYQLEDETMAPKPVQKPHADLDGGRPSRTRSAAPPGSPTAGWARAARASPISPPRCRS